MQLQADKEESNFAANKKNSNYLSTWSFLSIKNIKTYCAAGQVNESAVKQTRLTLAELLQQLRKSKPKKQNDKKK